MSWSSSPPQSRRRCSQPPISASAHGRKVSLQHVGGDRMSRPHPRTRRMAAASGSCHEVCATHQTCHAMPAAGLAPRAQTPPYPRAAVCPIAGLEALPDTASQSLIGLLPIAGPANAARDHHMVGRTAHCRRQGFACDRSASVPRTGDVGPRRCRVCNLDPRSARG